MSEYNPVEEAAKQLEESQKHLEEYKEKLFSRFQDYILGMAVLPKRDPKTLPEELKEQYDKNAIGVLILLDDTDTKRLSKEELKEKLSTIFVEQAKEVSKNLQPEVLLLSELWELAKDGKYEILQDIAMSQIFFDGGMLSAIKLAELHKQMVLQKFEKYIVAYVLGGSLVQGTATTKSDVDVFIVIDDTDVKKMTRAELRDKLRAIIVDLGFQAGEMTGIQNKINIQVYILTDFWDNIKEANPVIFTFLRDGVPFYDRGIFMPWKQLLEMGRVKPSKEAIDQFMTYGDQYLKRIQVKLKEIGVDDFFWATVTPSQAAIMMLGHAPPTPKELVAVMRELFVKQKLLEKKHVDDLEFILKTRKAIEHGDKAEISGTEIDDLYRRAEAFVARLNKLFEQLQADKDKEVVVHTYESAVTLVRDALAAEGVSVQEKKLQEAFEKELVQAGKVPEKFARIFGVVLEAKSKYDAGKLSQAEAMSAQKEGRELFRYLLEHIQRKRGSELEQAKLRVQHQERVGELLFVGEEVFVVFDVSADIKELQRVKRTKKGFSAPVDVSEEEYEKAVSAAAPVSLVIDEELFVLVKKLFGSDARILVS